MPPPNINLSGADDPSTMSFADTTPPAPATSTPPDSEKLFNAEWDAAQTRYRAAVNSGYSESDAAQLYLDPVKYKWDILKDVPANMKRAAAVELDKAQASFVAGVNSGYKATDAENIYLKPAEQKWVAAAGVPDKKPKSEKQYYADMPAMQSEEAAALKEISGGKDIRAAIEDHPALLVTPGYDTRWNARYNSALTHDRADQEAAAKEKAKAEAQDDPEKLLSEYSKLGGILKRSTSWFAGTDKLPKEVNTAIQSKMAQVASKLPASLTQIPDSPSVQFQPSASDNYPTATNPKTGEKIIFKDGKWQPIQ